VTSGERCAVSHRSEKTATTFADDSRARSALVKCIGNFGKNAVILRLVLFRRRYTLKLKDHTGMTLRGGSRFSRALRVRSLTANLVRAAQDWGPSALRSVAFSCRRPSLTTSYVSLVACFRPGAPGKTHSRLHFQHCGAEPPSPSGRTSPGRDPVAAYPFGARWGESFF